GPVQFTGLRSLLFLRVFGGRLAGQRGLRQSGHRGGLVEDVRRQVGQPEAGAYLRDDLHADQRVAAEFEEVVVDSDALQAERLGPYRDDRLLGGRLRLDVGGGQLRARVAAEGVAGLLHRRLVTLDRGFAAHRHDRRERLGGDHHVRLTAGEDPLQGQEALV